MLKLAGGILRKLGPTTDHWHHACCFVRLIWHGWSVDPLGIVPRILINTLGMLLQIKTLESRLLLTQVRDLFIHPLSACLLSARRFHPILVVPKRHVGFRSAMAQCCVFEFWALYPSFISSICYCVQSHNIKHYDVSLVEDGVSYLFEVLSHTFHHIL